MDLYSRYLFCTVLPVLKVHLSAVTIKDDPLNWKEANEACQLINFQEVKTEYINFINEMDQSQSPRSGYWIEDSVTEFSILNKGCQKEVTILNSTTIRNNILSNCFQFCQNSASSTTIGIKVNNCSCLNPISSGIYLPISNCDLQCVWEGTPCRPSDAFSVFEQRAKIDNLSGNQIEECIAVRNEEVTKLNCSSPTGYICQTNNELKNNSDKATWIEAVSKCAEKNQTLAYYLPSSKKYNNIKSSFRHWIGIREYYQTKPVEVLEESMCPVIRRYNNEDIQVTSIDCRQKRKYICLKEPTTTPSIEMTKSSHPVINNKDSSSSNAVGIVIGVLATIAILLLVFICVFKRRRNNQRTAYQSPVIEYSSGQRRDSKQSQTKSVKSSPLKPARRSKKTKPDSLVSGTEYENIVLTFEDPSMISRVVSSTSTEKTEILNEGDDYDVMNTKNKKANETSQNVYGFSSPEGEYDVMNRENRNVDDFNPEYDHM